MKKLAILMTVILCSAMSNGYYGSHAQGGPDQFQMAPVNPEFIKYMEALKAGRAKNLSDDGHPLGYAPPPFLHSHYSRPAEAMMTGVVYPATYDLRTMGKLTAIRNQGSCGACWAFGGLAALESFFRPGTTFDFAEQHLIKNHGFDSSECAGGGPDMTEAYFTRWEGPYLETEFPYLYTSGSTPAKHVQQTVWAPYRDKQYLANDDIKYFITNYGAASCCFYYGYSFYSDSNYAYYCNDETLGSNHIVAIVGWDDNYDKNKFKTPAPGNGAFICKNSWGTVWGESGYFYMSYYDATMGGVFAFSGVEPANNYKSVYQYDPLGRITAMQNWSDTPYWEIWGANIFTAASTEKIGAVGTYATTANTQLTAFVYTNVTAGKPESGTLAATKALTAPYDGFYTIKLDSAVTVVQGQKFSVVVKYLNGPRPPGDRVALLPTECVVFGYSEKATNNLGESFSRANVPWAEWYDLKALLQDNSPLYKPSTQNCCIKAYVLGDSCSVTSPNGGESWLVGTSHNITWAAGGGANVRIEYSTDNGLSYATIISSTANTGSYAWTVPNSGSANCLIRVSDTTDAAIQDASDAKFSIVAAARPTINLNKTSLCFNSVPASTGTVSTCSQSVIISNTGGWTLNWKVVPQQTWMSVTPLSGSGTGVIQVVVNPGAAGVPGAKTGTILVSDDNATNNPQAITVNFNIKTKADAVPFGEFATPANNTPGVTGAIPVTGWAMDDIEVTKVEIWRDSFAGETAGIWKIGDAVFVEGARPDIEAAFPDYPLNYRAGWGYMLLTNMLPGHGNGTYRLHAYISDKEGNRILLGTKTIVCDNDHGVKPFGAIDSPAQGGDASGNSYWNFGWVLTPQTKTVPKNGSTILVYIDGAYAGNLATAPNVYNQYRADVSEAFPGLNNTGAPGAGGPVGAFFLDTTTYPNGVHTISWVATDDAGAADGIGSRYFNIVNMGTTAPNMGLSISTESVMTIPVAFEPRTVKRGFSPNASPDVMRPDRFGILRVESKEVERIEVDLGKAEGLCGYMVVGKQIRSLPIGSTLDPQSGTFAWIPGPGFIGPYDLLFLRDDGFGVTKRIYVRVNIKPKFGIK